MAIGVPSITISSSARKAGLGLLARKAGTGSPARAAHDLALAALIGGNLFGRVAMHPALTSVSDQSERGRVLNRAWRRYGIVNSLALLTLVSGWLEERRRHEAPRRRRWPLARRAPETERTWQRAEDAATVAVLITGLASALSGVTFAQQAPKGAVPMRSGSEPAPEATASAARLKKAVNALGALNLASELALVAVDSAHHNGHA
jgi:hypothetical protein